MPVDVAPHEAAVETLQTLAVRSTASPRELIADIANNYGLAVQARPTREIDAVLREH